MTAARTPRERRERAAQVGELSLALALNRARYANAQERTRERAARAARRYDALQPLLAKAGYGPHGAAPRLRAEARAIDARRDAGRGTEHTGPGCRVCAEGRRMDVARGRVAGYGREITRLTSADGMGQVGTLYGEAVR
jgi:hypothetical protein